jgi:cytochrome b
MMQTTRKRPESVPVWDPLIRIFHWSLVGFFLLAYFTEDELLTVHVYAGYAVAGLIVFRLIWGSIGTRHARFTDFVTGPARLTRYLGQLVTGRAPRYLGHNPAGAAMIIALLASLTLATLTGFVLIAGEGAGPLAATIFANLSGEAFEEAHEFFANLTLFLVVIHVVGVLISSFLHQENLIKSMVTGRKRIAPKSTSDNRPFIPGDNMEREAS